MHIFPVHNTLNNKCPWSTKIISNTICAVYLYASYFVNIIYCYKLPFTMKQLQRRLLSIDVFRALTMLLMIFVNDFDGVEKVPEWIKHAHADEDALGFADVIFPAFLVIVGLSIPFAIKSRLSRGQSRGRVFATILLRSLALLVMGVYHVNLENYSPA